VFDKTMVRFFLSAVALVAACFGNATIARADQITYNIIDYPSLEADQFNGGQDSVAGSTITIVGDDLASYGPNAAIPIADITSMFYSVTFSNTPVGSSTPRAGTWTGSVAFAGSPIFTGSQITVPIGSSVTLWYAGYLGWDNGADGNYSIYGQLNFPDAAHDFRDDSQSVLNSTLGIPSDSSTWLIADVTPVPEPSVAIGLGTTLLGLGLVYLRRRRAKA
jgi:hypothetical protein